MRLPAFFDKYREMFMSFATTEVVRIHSRKIQALIRESTLRQNILNSTTSGVTDREYVPGRELVVSLTTFGPRIEWCSLAIESIMEQTVKANRIVLWLGREFERPHMIPEDLRMLERRGLEIRFTDDCGPATKLVPSLKAFPEDLVITIDDDTIYSFNLLDKLLRGYRQFPESIICDRVTWIHAREDGSVYYTEDDKYVQPTEPSIEPVPIGSAGVLYPPHSLHEDVFDMATFKELSPKADDLWFKVMGLRADTTVFCVGDESPIGDRTFDVEHYDRKLALYTYNVFQNGNNVQFARLAERYPEAFVTYRKSSV